MALRQSWMLIWMSVPVKTTREKQTMPSPTHSKRQLIHSKKCCHFSPQPVSALKSQFLALPIDKGRCWKKANMFGVGGVAGSMCFKLNEINPYVWVIRSTCSECPAESIFPAVGWRSGQKTVQGPSRGQHLDWRTRTNWLLGAEFTRCGRIDTGKKTKAPHGTSQSEMKHPLSKGQITIKITP